MKKIIEKIKANKNLYKGLKIFKLVLDFLVYGFAIFMLIGLAIGSTYKPKESQAQEKQLIPNVATTPVKHAYDYGGLEFFESSRTFASHLEVWKGLLQQKIGANTFSDGYSRNSYGSYTYTLTSNYLDFAYSVDILTGWEEPSDIVYCNISSMEFIVSHSSSTPNYQTYIVDFILDRPNVGRDYNVRRYYYRDFYSSDGLVGDFVSGQFYNYLTNDYQLYNECFIYEKGSSIYEMYEAGDKSYWDGYDKGYDLGYGAGYRVGHTDGVAEGFAQTPNNVFAMISSAFTAIASFLNIQILPNLSLGLLLFTPLAVTIIIVVVKMIKG